VLWEDINTFILDINSLTLNIIFTSIFKYSSVAEKISSDLLNELIYFEASFIYIVSFIDGGHQRNP